MKKLITLLFVLLCFSGFGQVYQLMPQYGYQANRMRFDSTLQIPTVCGVPTLKSNVTRLGAIAFDSCNNRFYTYNPKTATWSQVSGGGGSTDTTSLSNRINLKLDSVKRRTDSVFAYRNGTEVFQFLDSVKYDTSTVVIMSVVNATGTTLLKGEVVYLFGATGSTASVKRANNKSDSTSSKTIGIVRRDIAAGATGTVTTQGQVEKLDLGAYNEGDILWLDSIDGGLTKNKPQAPFHAVFVGVVERANSGNGLMYIKPQNGVELDEVHDVQIQTPLNNQTLVYSDTQRVWKNRLVGLEGILNNGTTITGYRVINGFNSFELTRQTDLVQNFVRVNETSTDGVSIFGGEVGTNFGRLDLSSSVSRLQNTANNGTANVVGSIEISGTDGRVRIRNRVGLGTEQRILFPTTAAPTPGRSVLRAAVIGSTASQTSLEWANDSIGSTDTTSLSNRINTKLNISDTSVFDRKLIPANSFMANNTASAANSVATFFKDTSGTYTGTVTWTGTTAPSGTTNFNYRYSRVGRVVNLSITLNYGTAGNALTAMVVPFQADFPTPSQPAGLTSASDLLFPANVQYSVNNPQTLFNAVSRSWLRRNSANNGFEIVSNFGSGAIRTALINVTYFVD